MDPHWRWKAEEDLDLDLESHRRAFQPSHVDRMDGWMRGKEDCVMRKACHGVGKRGTKLLCEEVIHAQLTVAHDAMHSVHKRENAACTVISIRRRVQRTQTSTSSQNLVVLEAHGTGSCTLRCTASAETGNYKEFVDETCTYPCTCVPRTCCVA